MLQINYEANVRIKDVYSGNFEEECEAKLQAIANFIKKEFRSLTGNSLSITPQGECKCIVQHTSRVRTFVMAHRLYKIGGMQGVETLGEAVENPMDVKYQKFLKEGSFNE